MQNFCRVDGNTTRIVIDGKNVLIDTDDLKKVSQCREWFITSDFHVRSSNGKQLNRLIVGEDIPEKHHVIHKNYNRLDCRKRNLVVVNKTESKKHRDLFRYAYEYNEYRDQASERLVGIKQELYSLHSELNNINFQLAKLEEKLNGLK